MWSLNNMRQTCTEETPSSHNPCTHQSWVVGESLPSLSWSQLLLGEEERYRSFSSREQKKMESWNPLLRQSPTTIRVGVKPERPEGTYLYGGHGSEEIHVPKPPWIPIPQLSTSGSCFTSFSSSMLDFTNRQADGRETHPDHSLECNSPTTSAALKKAKSDSSSPYHSSTKMKKEKLGDRITVLHQLVSPYGKTDTASVLLEAIGYIRFLHSQIEALCSPYMCNGPPKSTRNLGERGSIFPGDHGQMLPNNACVPIKRKGREPYIKGDKEETKKDLRHKGLCLIPTSCIMHVDSDSGSNFWPPSF